MKSVKAQEQTKNVADVETSIRETVESAIIVNRSLPAADLAALVLDGILSSPY